MVATATKAAPADEFADVAVLAPDVRRELYESMVLSRVFETEAERQYKAARIGGYCHLSSGQEATTVGTVHALHEDDLLVT
ncbi:MAG TPA: thiamine pyrophosphate-dependent enzyme, partial [Conexibacter sp.]|nr:thiamine pyrophosphate-dependent enzyme [Conexibacter sp.]